MEGGSRRAVRERESCKRVGHRATVEVDVNVTRGARTFLGFTMNSRESGELLFALEGYGVVYTASDTVCRAPYSIV
jgi:hypothetical protein